MAYLQPTEKILQSYISDQTNDAYATALIGKWHLSANETERPTQMGIDYFAGIMRGGVTDYYDWDLVENEVSNGTTDYVTSKLTDLGIDWIAEQENHGFVGWRTPLYTYAISFAACKYTPTRRFTNGQEARVSANPQPTYGHGGKSDFEMGRMLTSLSPEELANTIVIFIGDNSSQVV